MKKKRESRKKLTLGSELGAPLFEDETLLGDVALLGIIDKWRQMGWWLSTRRVRSGRQESATVEAIEHPLRLTVDAIENDTLLAWSIDDLVSDATRLLGFRIGKIASQQDATATGADHKFERIVRHFTRQQKGQTAENRSTQIHLRQWLISLSAKLNEPNKSHKMRASGKNGIQKRERSPKA